MTINDGETVAFHFDPYCPWTWATSRWLVEVAAARGFDIRWRSFSLAVASEGQEGEDKHRAGKAAGRAALRIVEALLAQDRNDDVARFYTELGRRWHHGGDEPSNASVAAAAEGAGVEDVAAMADDPSWDDALRASFDEADELAGPGIGSPVLVINGRAIFGPVVSPPPTGADALELWDALSTIVALDGVYELKRTRPKRPEPGPRP